MPISKDVHNPMPPKGGTKSMEKKNTIGCASYQSDVYYTL